MSLKRQTLWSMLPLLSITIVNLVSVPLFYKFLGAEMYALWFYVASLSGAFGFMDMGLGVAVGRYIGVALGREDTDAVREYWGTANMIAIPMLSAMALAFTAIGVIFGPSWFNVGKAHVDLLRYCFLIGGIGLFLAYYAQFWVILSLAHLEFRYIAVLRTVTAIGTVTTSVGVAWLTSSPLALIIWGCLLGCLQLLVLIVHAGKSYQLGIEIAKARWTRLREMAAYTGKTFISLIVNSFLGSADRLILAKLAPAVAFSHYTIALNAGARIQSLSTAVMGPVFCQTNQSLESGGSAQVAKIYNEIFDFTFPWYLLIAIWTAVWHDVILRLWLGVELAAAVSPVLTPIVLACCITGIANMSAAQLGSLNRVGTILGFNVVAGVMMVGSVYIGWRLAGLAGVAWGFLASRLALIAQDLFLARLIGARGWMSGATLNQLLIQGAVALAFYPAMASIPRDSYFGVIPATLHLVVVAAWILRSPLRQYLAARRNTSHPNPIEAP